MNRRVLLMALVLAVAVAGCTEAEIAEDFPGISSEKVEDEPADPADTDTAAAGTFELLVSDQPTAIDEFERLEVTFSHTRIFPGDPADADRGFEERDLDNPTVDLTQVVGTRAMSVLETELSAGEYRKVELFVEDVNAVRDDGEEVPEEEIEVLEDEAAATGGGNDADMQVPSGKLMITKPFEIEADGTTSFVFDIDVVRRGQAGGYNLLPNIGESGVAGQDVQVDRIN